MKHPAVGLGVVAIPEEEIEAATEGHHAEAPEETTAVAVETDRIAVTVMMAIKSPLSAMAINPIGKNPKTVMTEMTAAGAMMTAVADGHGEINPKATEDLLVSLLVNRAADLMENLKDLSLSARNPMGNPAVDQVVNLAAGLPGAATNVAAQNAKVLFWVKSPKLLTKIIDSPQNSSIVCGSGVELWLRKKQQNYLNW